VVEDVDVVGDVEMIDDEVTSITSTTSTPSTTS